jgi:uncharacterized protein DUF2867
VRLPDAAHDAHPWRIHDLVPDFTVEDVWALPVHGGADDFQGLVELMVSSDPAHATSLPTRVLWRARDGLGRTLGLGRIAAPAAAASTRSIPGTHETSLAERLPEDLRGTAAGLEFASLPFTPLYRTDVEFAAELSNPTVHGVMHLGWVDEGRGLPERRRYEGRMAVLVKPRGRFGELYMALIRPFRHAIVYPALMRQIERAWNGRARTAPSAATPTDG